MLLRLTQARLRRFSARTGSTSFITWERPWREFSHVTLPLIATARQKSQEPPLIVIIQCRDNLFVPFQKGGI